MQKNIFNKIAFRILIIFIIFVPFNAFLVTFLPYFFWKFFSEEFLGFFKFLIFWKEILLSILFFLFIWKFFKEKSFPIKKIFLFDKIFLLFFLVALWFFLVNFDFSKKYLIQSIWWFRLDFIYFFLFYLVRGFYFNSFQIKKIFYVFIFSWLVSLIFWFFLYSKSFNRVPEKIITSKKNFIELSDENKNFIKNFYEKADEKSDILRKKKNISDEEKLKKFFENPDLINFRNENFLNLMVDLWYSSWVSNYEVNKSLPAFHFIEAKWTARFASTFAWPNQLWFYLMLFIGMILGYLKFSLGTEKSLVQSWRLNLKFQEQVISLLVQVWNLSLKFKERFLTMIQRIVKSGEKIFLILTLIFALICLYFTFSRSAWLWTFLIFWLFTFFSFPQKYRLKLFFWWLISVILLGLHTYFFQYDFFNRVVLRWGSTSMHLEKTLKWIEEVKQNPFWLWIWKAWPVTMRFSKKWEEKIAENWFVQMFQEFWILWWIIYLLFILSFLRFLIKNFNNFLIFWWFLWLSWILTAWMFLHSFEDIWVSLLLFLFLWIWFNYLKKWINWKS